MRNRILIVCLMCMLAQWSMAQAPKWAEKARRAVFSVVTYDKDNKILNTGNGFFVTEDGVAISDYTLFKGAHSAVVMTADGEKMSVAAIMGANDMYDVVKFRVDITSKKVSALPIVSTPPAIGATAWLLPYSTQKVRSLKNGKISAADKVAEYSYYTISMPLKDKMVSCPLMTDEGEVFGLTQKAMGQDTATICYALDARFAVNQEITAFSYNDITLQQIGIKKALPNTEDQALVFLYMASSQLNADKYAMLLDDFIEQFPQSADGYMRRATNQLFLSKDENSIKKVEADFEKALEVSLKKDEVYFNRAKMIYAYFIETVENPYESWNLDAALADIKAAIAIQRLPVYVQLEGDIYYLKQDFTSALACYEEIDKSNIRSAATLFTTAKTKEMMQAPIEEVLALMDSCVAQFNEPYTSEAAPYLLERARVKVNANQARMAIFDYDACFKALNGIVNDNFYYLRSQACLQARQYQRALDDLSKAIEINPNELTYYAELSVVNMRVGRNEEAIKVLQSALAVDANYAEVYRLMGIAYIQMKKNKDACVNFNKAKTLGDPNVDALIEKYCK
ncbi:MAG: tetratricopeptide repeat protein [Mediterranea massiliensis]|nr:tetratricopeptide repeat protein [Mediterranea massiliensis]